MARAALKKKSQAAQDLDGEDPDRAHRDDQSDNDRAANMDGDSGEPNGRRNGKGKGKARGRGKGKGRGRGRGAKPPVPSENGDAPNVPGGEVKTASPSPVDKAPIPPGCEQAPSTETTSPAADPVKLPSKRKTPNPAGTDAGGKKPKHTGRTEVEAGGKQQLLIC